MKSIFKVMTVLAALHSMPFAHAQSVAQSDENSIDIGGLNITGSGLVLVGSVSTWTKNEGNWNKIGWGLVIVGMLVDSKDLVSKKSKESASVIRSMNRECHVAGQSNELASSSSAYSAASKLGFVAGNSPKEKVSNLCSVFTKTQKNAKALIAANKSVDHAALVDAAGTSDLSAQDLKSLRNMYAMSGAI